MPYRHRLRIRYGECDMQGIVFNAHYLAYCDDAFGAWAEAAIPGAMAFVGHAGSFDVLVKRAVGSVDGTERFDVVVTYVNVTPGTHTPVPVAGDVRAALQG